MLRRAGGCAAVRAAWASRRATSAAFRASTWCDHFLVGAFASPSALLALRPDARNLLALRHILFRRRFSPRASPRRWGAAWPTSPELCFSGNRLHRLARLFLLQRALRQELRQRPGVERHGNIAGRARCDEAHGGLGTDQRLVARRIGDGAGDGELPVIQVGAHFSRQRSRRSGGGNRRRPQHAPRDGEGHVDIACGELALPRQSGREGGRLRRVHVAADHRPRR